MPFWNKIELPGIPPCFSRSFPVNFSDMAPKKRFSVRHGIQPEPGPILEDAPEGLRYFLLDYLRQRYVASPWQAVTIVEGFLREPGLATNFYNPHDPTAWQRLYQYIRKFEWWEVYDFIEEIYASFVNEAKRLSYGQPNYYECENFAKKLNEVFERENIRYELKMNGEIVYKGSEPFEAAVSIAQSVLRSTNRQTANSEIQEALRDLSRRPKPDLTGAVHHAMNALESVAKDIWQEKGTLGDFIKRHPEQFPEPLASAVSRLYGFASDKGRHIKEGGEPDLKEVELVVGIAATVTTYLIRANITPPQ